MALAEAPPTGVVAYPASFFADARPNTAFDMIQRLPGFSFDGGAQVRGFAGAAGNVLIDGQRPTIKQDDLQSVLSRIPAAQVERIDLIRGGAPGIDMQGRTVLANVVRKRDGGLHGAASLTNGFVPGDGRQAPTLKLQGSGQVGDHKIEASLLAAEDVDDGVGPGPHIQTDPTGAVTYRAHLSARGELKALVGTVAEEQPLAGGTLKINALWRHALYEDIEADAATLPAGDNDTYQDITHRDRAELGFNYVRDFGGQIRSETLFLQQFNTGADRSHYIASGDDEIFAEVNRLFETIVRTTLRDQITPRLSVQAALEGDYNYQITDTRYLINAVLQPLPAADVSIAERRGEAALSATWTPSARYTIEAGVRLEASALSVNGDMILRKDLFYPKPRLVFTWSPDPDDQLRLRVEREVGQLDFGAFTASGSLNSGGLRAGNPDLSPQDVWVGEAALERRFWTEGDATVTLRHSQIADAVDRITLFDPNPPPTGTYFDQPGNIGPAREDDAIFDLTLPLRRLGLRHSRLKLTGTWRWTRVIDPTTLTARPLTQIHPFDGEVHFTQDLPKWRANWGLDYFAANNEHYYRFDELDVVRADPYYSAFAEYKPARGLSFKVELDVPGGAGVTRQYQYYAVLRGGGAVPYEIDARSENHGPMVYLRVRKDL